MDIDLAALRALERERGIALSVLIPAIEQALLLAYQRTEGAHRQARAELDRKTGHVVIWAREQYEVEVEPEPVVDQTDGQGESDDEAEEGLASPGHPPRVGSGVRRHPDRLRSGGGHDGSAGHRAATARHRG